MGNNIPLVLTGTLNNKSLEGKGVIVTGAGTGIGFEAARSLAYLGAKVIIAEIRESGRRAADKINDELGKEVVYFVKTDVGEEQDIKMLKEFAKNSLGKVDIIINNATVAPLGSVIDNTIDNWDISYRVNLRGPVLLAKAFLPDMVNNQYGVFICVTSEGLAYMGAYESMKAAQVHLSRTIEGELEEKGIISFVIGPGYVPTETAKKGMEYLAEKHSQTLEEMELLVKDHMISIEEAGAGFAAAAALASQFKGQEIGSKQALIAADIVFEDNIAEAKNPQIEIDIVRAQELIDSIYKTLLEQSEGWKKRSIFERQWIYRDFKKHAGFPIEQWLEKLDALSKTVAVNDVKGIIKEIEYLNKLSFFYEHQKDLAKGYTKDKNKLEEQLSIIEEWKNGVDNFIKLFGNF